MRLARHCCATGLATLLLASLSACIEPFPDCTEEPEAPTCLSDAGVPLSGTYDPALQELDEIVESYVSQYCIGSATLAISFGGEQVFARGYGYLDGPPSRACKDRHDRFVGGAPVYADTPIRIGSVGKNITAAVTRDALRAELEARGLPASEADIEALPLVGGPFPLMSPRISAVMAGEQPPPFAVEGSDCSAAADERWRLVTVGHVIGHRTGLTGDLLDIMTGTHLQAIRGLSSHEALAAEQALVDPPDKVLGSSGYFVRPETNEEALYGQLGECLSYTPGTQSHYSNTGFDLLSHVAHTVSGTPEVALTGDADSHEDSLVHAMLLDTLGVEGGNRSTWGIYLSQPFHSERDPEEPRYREWDGESYYPSFRDPKRPFCTLVGDGGTCSLDPWQEQEKPYNELWKHERVDIAYKYRGKPVGTGLLAAEAPLLVKFLDHYWLGGVGKGSLDDGVAWYGRPRPTHQSPSNRAHNGSLSGVNAWAMQFVGASFDFNPLPPGAHGGYNFEAPLDAAPESCDAVPDQVNLALLIGQRGSASCSDCDLALSRLRNGLMQALCEVDWAAVESRRRDLGRMALFDHE